jgi:ankyrin repeat protein
MLLALRDFLKILKYFVYKEPISLHLKDNESNSLLHTAVINDQYLVADFLIKKGALVNQKNKNGKTAFSILSSKRNINLEDVNKFYGDV